MAATATDQVGIRTITFYYAILEDPGVVPEDLVWNEIATIVPLKERDKYSATCDWEASQLPPGYYAVKVIAFNYGNLENSQIKRYQIDRDVPEAPSAVMISDSKSGGELVISWERSSSTDTDHYDIYRSEDPDGMFQKIGESKSLVYRDAELENGRSYYYMVKAVDGAGNESAFTQRVGGVPTAQSDFELLEILCEPTAPAYGRAAKLTAKVRNQGFASASGTVTFTLIDNGEPVEIGVAPISLAQGAQGSASLDWLVQEGLSSPAEIRAQVTTAAGSADMNLDNNAAVQTFSLNLPPQAVISLPLTVKSGEMVELDGRDSLDSDGKIVAYLWQTGDGNVEKKGALATHMYQIPGEYTVTLTVRDNHQAESTATAKLTVTENRPDLVVSRLTWSPTDPQEGDTVQITATIGNTGVGAAHMGFLVGFYMDGKYLGYRKVEQHLGVGQTVDVPFNWIATPGIHVLKVVANDILDNLKETNLENNSLMQALSSEAVNFPDVEVTSVSWSPADSLELVSEDPFVYRAKITNLGTRVAERFFVSLYIDGVWQMKQHVNYLAPGMSQDLSFVLKPLSGQHTITVKADDPVPALVELETDNNSKSVTTPQFTVRYPTLALAPITWQPQETVLTEGTSLTLETKVVNTGDINITHRFFVDFLVDDVLVKSLPVDRLAAGEEKDLWVRWPVAPGTHRVQVVADAAGQVTEGVGASREAETPELALIYPDLTITDVTWTPLSFTYGKTATFYVWVSNQSVSTVFDSFSVAIYNGDQAVTQFTLDGLRGHSTAVVALRAPLQVVGSNTFRIVIDPQERLTLAPPGPDTRRSWERTFEVADALVMTVHAPKAGEAGVAIFTASDDFIPMEASLHLGSDRDTLLGPEEGVLVTYTLVSADESMDTHTGVFGFDRFSGKFKGQHPLLNLDPGYYDLTIEGTDGIETLSQSIPLLIIQEMRGYIDADKENYLAGEPVILSGELRFMDGTPAPYYNAEIKIGATLYPIQTDENGRFERVTYRAPGAATAGIKVGSQVIGNASFVVWGLGVTPADLTFVASKNSQFSRTITIYNPTEDRAVTGLTAQLIDLTPGSNVRATLDTSTLGGSIPAEKTAEVVLNVNAPLDAADTAEYRVVFSTAEGPQTEAKIKILLRPAVPFPVLDITDLSVATNPGKSLVRTVKVTNKGLGTMTGIRVVPPATLPWVVPQPLGTTELQPGEWTTFDILVSPTAATPLGYYYDLITVTDGKYSASMGVGVEVSSATTGSLAFLVQDEGGSPVPNAEITLIGKEPYTRQVGGKESVYYQNFLARTDENGLAEFLDKPLGDYTYTVRSLGTRTTQGETQVMPATEPSLVVVTVETEPVKIEWTVVPTTIADEYDIELRMVFGMSLPAPKFGMMPPWVIIPTIVEETMLIDVKVTNLSLIAITDVVAEIRRDQFTDTGISIVGGGYIGELLPHESATIRVRVAPGRYILHRDENGENKNILFVQGSYVSFDPDTGLPEDPPKLLNASINFWNPTPHKVKVEVEYGQEIVPLVIDYPNTGEGPPRAGGPLDTGGGGGGGGGDAAGVYEVVELKLDQKATLERQAFNATLKVTNGYSNKSLENLAVRVVVTDLDGTDVTDRMFVIPTDLTGLNALDGSDSLRPGKALLANWQLIPGEGLGGTDPEGQVYLAKALISYYVDGRYVETSTQAEEITITPQPKIILHYYLPKEVEAGQPFRLGVVAENVGDGWARNLTVDSGQIKIETNQAGVQMDIRIVGTSFGSYNGEGFRLTLGDIAPHSQVAGYWIINWTMYEDRQDYDKPPTGEFREFTATLSHRDYKGVQLNPLIVGVTTEIIGRDNLYADAVDPDMVLTLIDEGYTGFPSYLMNMQYGLRIPIYVPQMLEVLKQPETEDRTLLFRVPAPEGDPNAPDTPRYQVLLLKDPLPGVPVRSVQRDVGGDGVYEATLSHNNVWKANGNIYIVDEVPRGEEEYYQCYYLVDFRSGAQITAVEYAQWTFVNTTAVGSEEKYLVWYDIGHYPDEGDLVELRARIENLGSDQESGTVEFFIVKEGSEEEVLVGSGGYRVDPLRHAYVYTTWRSQEGGNYRVIARIKNNDSPEATGSTWMPVNFRPIADAGVDFSADVLTWARFDGTRSYDQDGYIVSAFWDFGDGESGGGLTPTHKYLHSGTYKVTVTVTDNNWATDTAEMQITVRETRADLRVRDIRISPEDPKEGDTLAITGTVYNGGYKATDKPFLVTFYADHRYQDYVRWLDPIAPEESVEVSFTWVNTPGNHIFTIKANDFGHPVDEADFDNNQRSVPLDTAHAYFPNLRVSRIEWDGPHHGQCGWNELTTIRALIENNGSADAGSFNAAFYVDGELIGTQRVPGLSDNPADNLVEVGIPWRVTEAGVHTLRVVADAPIAHLQELDDADNAWEIETPALAIHYPDLVVKEVTFTPSSGSLREGQPLLILVTLKNQSASPINRPFNVTLYAGGEYLGSRAIAKLGSNEETGFAFNWNRPAAGINAVKVVLDERDEVAEADETNNSYSCFTPELFVRLPELVIEQVVTDPPSGVAGFGEELNSTVVVRNTGIAPVEQSFDTALFVNDKQVGYFTVPAGLAPGSEAMGTITWKADLLPTHPYYRLSAFADIRGAVPLTNRDYASFRTTYQVRGCLEIDAWVERETYTVAEAPVFNLLARSTDEPWRLLGPDNGVEASVSLYVAAAFDEVEGTFSGDPLFSGPMGYDPVESKFEIQLDIASLNGGLLPGSYMALVKAERGEETLVSTIPLQLVPDYTVAVDLTQQSYNVDEPIQISGQVKDAAGNPLAGIPVQLSVIGEEELVCDLTSDEEGRFSSELLLPYGYGGTYSLTGYAFLDGAEKASAARVFYVEGPYLALPETITVVQGYTVEESITLTNVGTIPLTGLQFVAETPADGGLSAAFSGASTSLSPGESRPLVLAVSALADAEPGDAYEAVFQVLSEEGYHTSMPVTIVVEEAVPAYRIDINGVTTDRCAVALRPGEVSTKVISITNIGTAAIEDIAVTPPQRLPWITVSASGTDLVLPIQGRTIRDENTKTTVLVTIAPETEVPPGHYVDTIQFNSNAGQASVTLQVYVGPETVGTVVLRMVDQDYIPIPKARVAIYGPHTTPGEQPPTPVTYRAEADADGLVTFMNVQAGDYTLSAQAAYHRDIQTRIDVQGIVDLEPRPIQLEKVPFVLSYDYRTLHESQTATLTGGDYEGAVLRAMLPATGQLSPSLQANFPGTEFWYNSLSSQYGQGNNFVIRNPAEEGSVYDVEARLIDVDPALPEGALLLKLANQTGGGSALILDEFEPGAAEEIHWEVNASAFYDLAVIQPLESEWDYQVTFPVGVSAERIAAWEKLLDRSHTLSNKMYHPDSGSYTYRIVPDRTVQTPYIPDARVPKFSGEHFIFNFVIEFTGNRVNEIGQWEACTWRVPGRLHWQPEDVAGDPPSDDKQGPKVTAAFTKESKDPPPKKKRTYPWYPPTKQQLRIWAQLDQDKGTQRYFSKNFLAEVNMVVPEAPENVGPAIGNLTFSQDVVTEQEVFSAKFELFNPSKYELIRDIKLELIITDGALDENGRLPEGARVYNDRFKIKPIVAYRHAPVLVTNPGDPPQPEPPDGEYDDESGNSILGWDLLPEDALTVSWQLAADPGLAETRMFNDELDNVLMSLAEHLTTTISVNSYIRYSFELDGQRYEGYSQGKPVRVEPQPKVFVSYSLESLGGDLYDLVVRATNAGFGNAYNFTLGLPSIPGMGEGQQVQIVSVYSDKMGEEKGPASLNLGDIAPGETKAGKFTILGVGLQEIAKLPTIPVEVTRDPNNPNIIALPLTMERAFDGDFATELQAEIDEMESNLHKILVRSASELGGVVTDAFDFVREQQIVGAWGTMINHTKAWINLLNFAKSLKPKYLAVEDKKKTAPDEPGVNKREKADWEIEEDWQELVDAGILTYKSKYGEGNGLYTNDYFQKGLSIVADNIKSWLKGSPEEPLKGTMTLNALLGRSEEESALLYYHLVQRKEYLHEIKTLEGEIEKAAEELAQAGRHVVSARAHAKEQASLIDLLTYGYGFDLEQEAATFLAYEADAAYYQEQAGVAFTAALAHSGDQQYAWFRKGRELFQTAKEMYILGESALAQVTQDAPADVKSVLERLRQAYLERAIKSNQPLILAQAQLERMFEKRELEDKVADIESFLRSEGISPDVIDLSMPSLGGIMQVLDAFTDLKQITSVMNLLPQWAEKLAELANAVRNAAYDVESSAQLLQAYVDDIYALSGGKEIPAERLNQFKAELAAISGDSYRLRRVLSEAINYMPFYADVSRESLTAIANEYVYQSTDRFMLDLREEIEEAARFNVYDMQQEVSSLLEEANAILEQYENPADTPAYYPAEVLLRYLRSVNAKLKNGWESGNYPNLWLYNGHGENLEPVNLNLGGTWRSQQEFYKILASGGQEVLELRYMLEAQRMASLFFGLATATMQAATLGTAGGIASMAFGTMTDIYDEALGSMEATVVSIQAMHNRAVAEALADNYLAIGDTLQQEVGVAYSVRGLLAAVDEWRKIDPPLPVTVLSFQIPHAVVEQGERAAGIAALTVRNDHTGTLHVVPHLTIYDQRGPFSYNDGEPFAISPGETIVIEIPFDIARSTLVDAAGYFGTVMFDVSEPGTMSIGGTHGPYLDHFFAGTSKEIEGARLALRASQPLGRVLGAGEQEEKVFSVDPGTAELRLFLAAGSGARLSWSLRDPAGNQFAAVLGAEERETNELATALVGRLQNVGDYLIIKNPAAGDYRVSVSAEEDAEDTFYALGVLEVPLLGAVPDVAITDSIHTNERETSFLLRIFETGYQQGIEQLAFSISDLEDEEGNVIPGDGVVFKGQNEAELPTYLPAGGGAAVWGEMIIPDELPDGTYSGIVSVTLEGTLINPGLYSFSGEYPVRIAGSSWEASDAGVTFHCPFTLVLDTAVPEAPVEFVARDPQPTMPNIVRVQGRVTDSPLVIILIDEVPTALLTVSEEGEFDATIVMYRPGTYQFAACATNFLGTMSEATASQTVVVASTGSNFGQDATLNAMWVNGELIDGFAPWVYDYSVDLPSGTTAVPIVSATANDPKAKVTVTQAPTVSGVAIVTVTAEDGVQKNIYTVEFGVASTDVATLRELKVNGTVVEGFSPLVTNYLVLLPYGTTQVPQVTAVATDRNAQVLITQAEGLPGTAQVVVTAADGTATGTYTISFEVLANADASLSDLQVDGQTIPEFDADTLTYSLVLPSGTTAVPQVTATATDANAVVEITDAVGLPGSATVTVTAADGVTTLTYTIDFTVAVNDDASLSDLRVDGQTVDGFDPETLAYTVVLPSGTTAVPQVTATATDAKAEVVVTQASELPGTATVTVTAADGVTTLTYTIDFLVAANTDASLSDLQVDGQTVDGFDPETLTYTVVLPSGTIEVPQVTATAMDSDAEVVIVQASELPGTATVTVTAADGVTTLTYMIDFTVAVNDDASLSDLQVDGQTVDGFDPETLTYTMVLPSGTTAVPQVTATATDSDAEVVIAQASELPGTATVTVTAADGVTTLTYTIDFTVAVNDDASLRDLKVDGQTVVGFDAETLTYTMGLPYGTTAVPQVTATATDANAEVVVTPATELPGVTTVTVTAADGATIWTYTINFLVAANTDASLSDLRVGGQTVDGFDPETLTYTVMLPYGTAEVPQVTASATDANAQVVVTQASELPGTAAVMVTAADGVTTLTYMIDFTVAVNDDASLSDLQVDGQTVDGFDPETLTYTMVLPSGTTAVPQVTATATDANAAVEVTDAVGLPGSATVTVTAADAVTTRVYTIDFTVALNTDASLSDLRADGQTVAGFDAETVTYNLVLPSGTTDVPQMTATAADANAQVVVIQASGLPGTATVTVTAADGATIWTYTINFLVAANTDASLSDLKVDGQTIAEFDSDTLTYTLELPYGTTDVPQVTATTTDGNAEVVITQASGLPGTTTVTVTAADGIATLTYTVNFTVAANTDASLSDLRADGQTVAGFDAETVTYNLVLPSGTTDVPQVTATAADANAQVVVIQASGLPGTATVTVTAADGTTTLTYTLNFTVAANNDAGLSDLKVDGQTIAGFAAETLTYTVVLPFGTTAVPQVTATATDANAQVVVTPASQLPGATTVTVTAADGVTTRTYTVAFKVIVAVTVTSQPAKLGYVEGEALDLSGLVVTFTYDDHTTEDVSVVDFAIRGIAVSLADGTELTLAQHGQSIAITFGGLVAHTDELSVVAARYAVMVIGGSGSGDYAAGEIVTIEAEPRSGYAFESWVVKEGEVTLADSNSATTTFAMPATPVTLEARFTRVSSPPPSEPTRQPFETTHSETETGHVQQEVRATSALIPEIAGARASGQTVFTVELAGQLPQGIAADVLSVEVPADVAEHLDGLELEVITPFGALNLPSGLLSTLVGSGNGISFTIQRAESAAFREELGEGAELLTEPIDIASELQGVNITLNCQVPLPAAGPEREAFLAELYVFAVHSVGDSERILDLDFTIDEATSTLTAVSFRAERFSAFALATGSVEQPQSLQLVTVIDSRSYTLNGEEKEFDNLTSFRVNEGTTVMAVRLLEELGATIEYEKKSGVGMVTVVYGDIHATLREGSTVMTVVDAAGTRHIDMRTAFANLAGRTYLPTRAVAENLGFAVHWDALDDSITIAAE
ncbi:MAG: CARDB domain-containing protein [Bacillota bacterium]